ncbi:hypothetical protein ACCD06_33655 [Azospirillum sp. CT11-132]|uniref:hypothetical protein n=1 Tax=Azospirillum sp. CT11-132 TaxID=3396317 RepID=UPI0039A73668
MTGIPAHLVHEWADTMKRLRPEPPNLADADAARQPVTVSMSVLDKGVSLRFVAPVGDELRAMDLTLNAVVAQAIAAQILKSGIEAGWLDAKGQVILGENPPGH